MSRLARGCAVLLCGCALSCGDASTPPAAKQEGEPFLRCAAPRDDGGRETLAVPPLSLVRSGHDLEIKGIARGLIVAGVLAGITEATPANLRNVGFFLDRFQQAGVQIIVVTGGVGREDRDVQGILAALGRSRVPVLITPGAEESFDLLRAELSRTRPRLPQLVDLTQVRRVRLGDVTLLSLPGYHDAFYLEARERGCSFDDDDLSRTLALADAGRTNVLVAAAPPRGLGEAAVDRARGGVNIGSRALAQALAKAPLKIGLFGHVYESAGHATRADGRTPVAPGVYEDELFLQPGAVDAVPLTLVGGGRAVGSAAVVELLAGRARFRMIPAPQLATEQPPTPTPL